MDFYGNWSLQRIIRCGELGLPPFSACTQMSVHANDLTSCRLLGQALRATQQWTALQKLHIILECDSSAGEAMGSVLSVVAGMQQLRQLEVHAPNLDASNAVHIQQYTQLTSLTIAPQQTAAADASPGWWDLSGLSSLVALSFQGVPAVQAAAGETGSFHLPNNLRELTMVSWSETDPSAMAGWVTHLPGCPQLQQLRLVYNRMHDSDISAPRLMRLLLQHNKQLRSLSLCERQSRFGQLQPDAMDPEQQFWPPGADLGSVKELKELSSSELCVRSGADWQHLAQLPGLTSLGSVQLFWAPPLDAGTSLQVLQLSGCHMHVGSRKWGRLLLACPLLKRASLNVHPLAGPDSAADERLAPHPTLEGLTLRWQGPWEEPAATAAEFAVLAPVVCRVSSLQLSGWPQGSSRRAVVMPDLSACTGLTGLYFEVIRYPGHVPQVEQEDILSMVAPLVQLRCLGVHEAERLDARLALVAQHMLPQLEVLHGCRGCDMPRPHPMYSGRAPAVGGPHDTAMERLRQLLRPGMRVLLPSGRVDICDEEPDPLFCLWEASIPV
jgi:hypothetical protein